MGERSLAGEYFENVSEVESVLGLPLLSSCSHKAQLPESPSGLGSLLGEPHEAERLARALGEDARAIWVAGLGDAGEELPVGVGLAAAMAAAGGPVLLLLASEEGDPMGLAPERPVRAGRFGALLSSLAPLGSWAATSGLQSVFIGCRSEGEPGPEAMEPVAVVVVSRGDPAEGQLGLPAPALDAVVPVIPYRDQPRKVLEERLEALRKGGYPLPGFVASGALLSETETAGSATETRDAAAREPEPAGGELQGENAGGLEAGQQEFGAEQGGGSGQTKVVKVGASWSQSFGPASGKRRQGKWLYWVVLLLLLAVGAFLLLSGLLSRPQTGVQQEAEIPAASALSGARTPAKPAPTDVQSSADLDVPKASFDEQVSRVASEDSFKAPAPQARPSPEEASASESAGTTLTPPKMVPTAQPPFCVQVGSFRDPRRAARLAAALERSGFPARVFDVEVPRLGLVHRVLVGNFAESDSALVEAQHILASGVVESACIVASGGQGRHVALLPRR